VVAESPGRDFFISYTQVSRPWAEWIAVQLEAAGYSTVLQAWDFRPGRDFLHEMQQATSTAGRTIAVLSPAYFGSKFSEAEWRAAFVKDPTGELGLLVPMRVQPYEPPGLLASRVYIDLVDVAEEEARRRLLTGVDQSGARPTSAPFPGAAAGTKRFPGQEPAVSNLPARNPNFSGRSELLEQLHASLRAGSAAAVVPRGALHGLGEVGKTELALEYAHRFASDYDVAWWIPTEQPTSAIAALAALAGRLGVTEVADQQEMIARLYDLLRGQDRWLLIYDNAERPERLEGLPPGAGGHVLVTSRWSAWGRQAMPLRVDVLTREESIAFLSERTGADDQAALNALAELLGDLPLALEEAAAYLEETGVGLGEYLELVRGRARELLVALFGIGQDNAGALLVAAGDNPQRLRSEACFAMLCGSSPIQASSGKTIRHRLNRGGDRQANAALYRIVLVRLRYHQPTKDYLTRRLAEGKPKNEIIRCLKRYIAREVFTALQPLRHEFLTPPT
jgi:TIR domain/Transposase IS116/IS110/IS902 family